LSYTQTFGYDELNRLTASQGERRCKLVADKQVRSLWQPLDRSWRRQSESLLQYCKSDNQCGLCVRHGGQSNDSTQSFAFDAENKIKTVNGENDVYRYDGDGNRVRKNFTYGEKVRMVNSGGHLIAEYDLANGSLKREYVYSAKGLVATIEPANGTRYTTADHLGTPRIVTNSSAGVVSRHDYMPFGEEVGTGIGGRTTGMGFSLADGLRLKFTLKERDNETGLDYFGARYFSSGQGRFTSPDEPLIGQDEPDPQTWNLYSYRSNNPLIRVDEDEQRWFYRKATDGLMMIPARGIPNLLTHVTS
jgi:RHS repeat-associated protein